MNKEQFEQNEITQTKTGKDGNIPKSAVIYSDERYTLGQQGGEPYLIADGEKYILSCHPFEPCLYITNQSGFKTAVRNAFDPLVVLEQFNNGETVASISGRRYDARDFCVMVEYAAGMGNIDIDIAEKAFENRENEKADNQNQPTEKIHKTENHPLSEEGRITEDEKFNALIAQYPDCVVDYCIVKTEGAQKGTSAHLNALNTACRGLFVDDDEVIWSYDCGGAKAKPIDAKELFAAESNDDKLNYRRAFLSPPYESFYTDKDFDKINEALFPNGIDGLEAYEWNTDWSEYFDDGHEWWGALCLTVYDRTLDRFVVIMASATD